MDWLLQHYQAFTVLMKENPVVAGAVSLYGLTVLGFLMRRVPKTIWDFLVAQCTTTLTMNNATVNAHYCINDERFRAFMVWFQDSPWFKFSRALSLQFKNDRVFSPAAGPGYGRHFFFHKGRFFTFVKSRIESSGTSVEKESVTITTLGRNQQPIINLISEFIKVDETDSRIRAFTYAEGTWNLVGRLPPRDIKTVVIEARQKAELMAELEFFFSNQKWYRDRGLAYKKTFVFHGSPGTGKTSLIKALACHYNRDVHILDITRVSGSGFSDAIRTANRGSFVVVEDFDSLPATHSRDGEVSDRVVRMDAKKSDTPVASGQAIKHSAEADVFEMMGGPSLSTILNTLQGIVELDDVVVFMTTNHLEKIDEALIRDSRVDDIYEISLLRDAEIAQYVDLYFPGHDIDRNRLTGFIPTSGSKMQTLFMKHHRSVEDFVNAIPRLPSLELAQQAA